MSRNTELDLDLRALVGGRCGPYFVQTNTAESLLPSLTKSGRHRSEGDLHARCEFVDDLYFERRLWGSFDSEPPTAGATKSDYDLVTSLGYSF